MYFELMDVCMHFHSLGQLFLYFHLMLGFVFIVILSCLCLGFVLFAFVAG